MSPVSPAIAVPQPQMEHHKTPCPATARSQQRISPGGICASSSTYPQRGDLSAPTWHRGPPRTPKVDITLHTSAPPMVLPGPTCQAEPCTSSSYRARWQRPLLLPVTPSQRALQKPSHRGLPPTHSSRDHCSVCVRCYQSPLPHHLGCTRPGTAAWIPHFSGIPNYLGEKNN